MNLAGKKVGEKPKVSKEKAASVSRPIFVKKKNKVSRRKEIEQALDDDDAQVFPDTNTEPEDAEAPPEKAMLRERVAAFEGGYVSSALRNAVNSHWRKSAETLVFLQALNSGPCIDGVFFGAIYVKSSFLRKTGGSALL